MEAKNGNNKLWLLILRWSARIIAILIAIFFLLMFFGEGIQDHSPNAQPLVAGYFIFILMVLPSKVIKAEKPCALTTRIRS
jgi:hypothetical protein